MKIHLFIASKAYAKMTQDEFVKRCANQISASLIKEGYGDLDRKWSELPNAIRRTANDIVNGVDRKPAPGMEGKTVGDYVKDNFGKDKGYGLKKFGRQIKRGAQVAAAVPALGASVAVRSGVKAAKDAYGSARGALKRFIGEDTEHEGIPTSYTHFAVRKSDNKIVNGWDYSDKDSNELKQNMKENFGQDLEDMGLDITKFKIFSVRGCNSAGINPFDEGSWDNVQPDDCR